MKLKCRPRHNAYKVLWLEKGQNVMVDEKCLNNLKVGNYEGNVSCDVVQMGF